MVFGERCNEIEVVGGVKRGWIEDCDGGET
jgi:hypothetical protein